jgi:hypothetical protein
MYNVNVFLICYTCPGYKLLQEACFSLDFIHPATASPIFSIAFWNIEPAEILQWQIVEVFGLHPNSSDLPGRKAGSPAVQDGEEVTKMVQRDNLGRFEWLQSTEKHISC